jgi:glycosyltransferase involved in cell wall biosynthesis
MKVALISSVVPKNAGGGGLVLYHRFKDLSSIELLVVCDGPVPGFNHRVLKHRISSRIFKRIAKTRLRRWGLDCEEFFLPCSPNWVARICESFKPDVILTVAHGNLWRLALREARSSKVPLVTLFQDWWPDLSGTHEMLRPLLDKQFRALHQNSAVSLCVCEGMLAALGPHPRAEILYDIPNRHTPSVSDANRKPAVSRELKLIYTGNLGDYGGMVQAALEATKEHPRIRLEAIGGNPAWPAPFRKEMQERGLWHDFVPQEKLGVWMATADAFLVAMRFEPQLRRFMETSFPSKIANYAQFHKPIVIWGPEYCSAIQWARRGDRALCITDNDPIALKATLEKLAGSPAWQASLTERAKQAAQTELNPETLQRQFLGSLQNVIRKTKQAA